MKNKKLLILLILMVIFPMNVFADDNGIQCVNIDNKTLHKGDSFECNVLLVGYRGKFSEISGDFTIPDLLTCEVGSIGNNLSGDSSTSKFKLSGELVTDVPISLKCIVNKDVSEKINAQITVNNFKYVSENGETSTEKIRSNYIKIGKKEETTTSTTTKNRSILNGNSLLKSVTSDAEFTFSKYITEYDIQVLYSVKEVNFTYETNISSAKVTLAAADSTITSSGNKVNVLLEEVGKKSFDLIVKSDDGGETVYTFNVERLDKGEGLYDKTKDATLSKLELGNYNLNFDPKTLEYTITVDSSVDSISVSATPTVEGAVVAVSNNTNIKNGTKIIVAVTALDKETKQLYSITVNKTIDYTLAINSAIIGIGGILILFLVLKLIKVMNHKSKDDPIYKYKMKQKNANTQNITTSVNNNTNNQSNL